MTTLYPHPFRSPMRLVTCFCVLLLSPFVASAQERNNLQAVETTLIGVFPGYAWTTPTAINNKGEIVGQAGPGVTLSYTDAFYWSARTGFRLIREGAVATDINDRGQVTVAWRPCDEITNTCTRGGGVWNRFTGQITDHLDGLFPKAINNSGDIAGDCISESLFAICAILRGERFQWSCGIADCHLLFRSMNEQGDIVGQKEIDSLETFESAGVFIPRGGRSVVLKKFWTTLDINNSRSIVGGIQEENLPFVWAHRRVLRMLSFVGVSVGINARGWVAGIDHSSQASGLAFVWSGTGDSVVYLSPGEWAVPVGINDRGEIVGVYREASGSGVEQVILWRVTGTPK